MNWARVSGFRSGDNPARWRGNLQELLPSPRNLHTRTHYRALPVATNRGGDAGSADRAEGIAARALEFLILTAARSGEVRGGRWDEIDADRRLWLLPGTRAKNGRPHKVPLSDAALALLETLHGLMTARIYSRRRVAASCPIWR
ncbi:MAG: tyrosine-type recombinase/integrase [Gammaproteobacteria bacterium]|nr:tyrosine-type recombinase/integrase [Gammaproteobacteria bacterium]